MVDVSAAVKSAEELDKAVVPIAPSIHLPEQS